jgi:hypothetical protein
MWDAQNRCGCLSACFTLLCNMKSVGGSARETGQAFDCPRIRTELRASETEALDTRQRDHDDEPIYSSAGRNKANIQDSHRDNLQADR